MTWMFHRCFIDVSSNPWVFFRWTAVDWWQRSEPKHRFLATLATLAPGISRCTWMFVQAQIGKTFVWCHQVTFQTSLECTSHTLTTKISMAHGVPRGPVTLVTCASLFPEFFWGFQVTYWFQVPPNDTVYLKCWHMIVTIEARNKWSTNILKH